MIEEEFSEDQSLARYWIDQLTKAKKNHRSFFDRGDKIIDRYKDKRSDPLNSGPRKINILWSNVETLKPSLYARTPKPECIRRFRDADPVAKAAAEVLERSLSFCIDRYDFDGLMRLNVSDYLLPGRGVAWVKYDYASDEMGNVSDEYAEADYVHWKDFLHNPARVWDEVWWVAKRAYKTRKEGVKRFGPVFEKIPEREDRPDSNEEDKFKENKIAVWEIWDSRARKVIFICESYKEAPLEVSDPFVNFENFFPCPRPLTTTTATDSVLPTPDYAQYQDQADELDDITGRIALLVKALRVVGVYDSSSGNLSKLLQDGSDNELIPVDNWAMFAQKGGIQGVISLLPIKEIAECLLSLYDARDRTKADMYEVTGISDIVRGASDPNETATAQGIKAQWGSVRIKDRQHEVQRYARDLLRLKAEVIAEHFSIPTLRAMTGLNLPTAQEKQIAQQQAMMAAQQTGQPPANDNRPTWEDVEALLRNNVLRSFRIDIETDSTIMADEQEEKAARTEFITSVTSFLQAAGVITQQAPYMAPLLGEMLLFGVRAYNTGEQLEETIEQTVDIAKQQPPQMQQELGQVKGENEKMKLDLQGKDLEAQKAQMDAQAQLLEKDRQIMDMSVSGKTEQGVAEIDTKMQEFRNEMQMMSEGLAVALQGIQQNNLVMAQAMTQMAQALEKIGAPRVVEIQRDKNGRAIGGVSRAA